MVRNSWLWSVTNTSRTPIYKLFYFIEGDVPRTLSDLNIRVQDDRGKDLRIENVAVNKPLQKEFFVSLAEPLEPGKSMEKIKLQYDWEEPHRNFYYSFIANCKKSSFQLLLPSTMKPKFAITRVGLKSGRKWKVNVPSSTTNPVTE